MKLEAIWTAISWSIWETIWGQFGRQFMGRFWWTIWGIPLGEKIRRRVGVPIQGSREGAGKPEAKWIGKQGANN